MIPYLAAYGLTLAAGFLRTKRCETELHRKNKNYCIAFAVIWVFLLGLRHPSMGVDLQYGSPYGYLGRFKYIASMRWVDVFTVRVQNYERGYILFNKILSLLGDHYQILLFTCALIAISLIAVWICLNSDYPGLSAVIYLGLPCFLINFSGLRQAVALAITTISIELIKRKKLLGFVLIVLLASTFHATAWIFLFAYPIYHFRMRKTASIATVLLPPVVYIFRYPLFTVLSRLFKPNAVPDNNGAFTLFLVFWAVYFFAVLFGHERDAEELGLRNLFLVACLCQALGSVHNTVMRVGYYFMISLVVLLPKVIKNSEKTFHGQRGTNNALIMYLAILVCFSVFGLYSIAHGSWAESNPYIFFWQ